MTPYRSASDGVLRRSAPTRVAPRRLAARCGRVALAALTASLGACSGGRAASSTSTATSAPTTAPVTAAPTTSTTLVATPTTELTTTTLLADVHHAFPVQDAAHAGFGDTHHDYPATDIFHPDGCGAVLVAPVDGVVLDLRRDDPWTASVDDPATRGGIFLSILGDDGVRYYMAHFRALDPGVEVGDRLAAGDVVGEMGDTGRAGACHLHFALSPPCPSPEWWVRRGVVWPADYLRAWQAGNNVSPVDEVAAWATANPDACSTAP